MKTKQEIKMLIGVQEELLKTHEKVSPNDTCITHIVINETINLLRKILD